MMSSLGNDKARGPREKAIAPVTHTSQPQKHIQVSNRSLQRQPESPFVKDQVYAARLLYCRHTDC